MELLHEDTALAVVCKPPGLATHRSAGCDDRSSCLSLLRNRLGRWVYPAHRLDRATSGVLAFGLTPEAARALGDAFLAGRVAKTYLAVVRGHPPDAGVIDRPLVHADTGAVQEAVTKFRTLARTEQPWAVRPYPTARYALVELTPLTGRTHQLRRHLSTFSHPIVGDTRYGDGAHNRAFAEHLGTRRLLLHAASLSLPHPTTDAALTFTAGLDPAFHRAAALFACTPSATGAI